MLRGPGEKSEQQFCALPCTILYQLHICWAGTQGRAGCVCQPWDSHAESLGPFLAAPFLIAIQKPSVSSPNSWHLAWVQAYVRMCGEYLWIDINLVLKNQQKSTANGIQMAPAGGHWWSSVESKWGCNIVFSMRNNPPFWQVFLWGYMKIHHLWSSNLYSKVGHWTTTRSMILPLFWQESSGPGGGGEGGNHTR